MEPIDRCSSRNDILDPSWEKQQKKAFTVWCNSHLRKVDSQIVDFDSDFTDGLQLIKLLEVISNEKLHLAETKNMRFHKIANVSRALKFIESKGIKLVSIGPEEIVDGNVKLTLGMIWTIILRFAIQNITIDESSAKEGLLLWCQRKTAGYPGVDVKNFHTSFKNGLAFAALIHKHRPDLIDFSSLKSDCPLDNLKLSFSVAELHLDIPSMLDPEDMLRPGKVDEHSVMAYVSSYYHRLISEEWAEKAAQNVCSLLKAVKDNQTIMSSFEEMSCALLLWIRNKIKWLSTRNEFYELDQVIKELRNCHHFSVYEKPEKYREKAELENMFYSVQARLKMKNRGLLDDRIIDEISTNWAHLDRIDFEYQDWIYSLYNNLRLLSCFAKKYFRRCDIYKIWLEEKRRELPQVDLVDMNNAKSMLNMVKTVLGAVEGELEEGSNITLGELTEMCMFLMSHDYHDMPSVEKERSELQDMYNDLWNTSQTMHRDITELVATFEMADKLLMKYATDVNKFKKWLDSAIEDMDDTILIRNSDDARQGIDQLDEFNTNMMDASLQLANIQRLVSKINNIESINLMETVYTSVSLQSVDDAWARMVELKDLRKDMLTKELANNERIEELTETLSNFCRQANDWMCETNEHANRISGMDCIDTQLELLREFEQKVDNFEDQLAVGENCYKEVAQFEHLDMRDSSYSIQTMRIDYENLKSRIRKQLTDIDNMKHANSAREAMTGEQKDNYTSSFGYFDNDKDGRLDYDQFDACMVSLGRGTKDNNQFGELAHRLDKDHNGLVELDDFLDYMMKEAYSNDSPHKLYKSFHILANGKDYITPDVLKSHLPEEVANYCVSRMNSVDGHEEALDYESFAKTIFNDL